MKLFLNDKQRSMLVEMLSATRSHALGAEDIEVARSTNDLCEKISEGNRDFYNLKREEVLTLFDFADSIRESLEKAIAFIDTKSEQSEEDKELQRKSANEFLVEIKAVSETLKDKLAV